MLKFLLFLRRVHFLLLFLALEAIAVSFFLRSNIYQKSRLVGLSSQIFSSVYDQLAQVSGYFELRSENDRLLEELTKMQSEIDSRRLSKQYRSDGIIAPGDSIPTLAYYQYQPARVVRNKITKRENYITINRGSLDGVEPQMALITRDGILGFVIKCSDHYSVAVSILNTKEFRSSGRLKGSDFFGSIYWDGLDHREVVLDEIPKYADVKVGDTVVTTEFSTRFPPDLPVGTVVSYEMINGTYYKVRLRLFADPATIRSVMVVRYLDSAERQLIEEGLL